MASLNDGRAELYTLTSLCGTLTISPFTQADHFTLGRGPSCSYRVSGEHGWVSEKHCRLSHNGGLSYFGLDVEHKTTCYDTSKNGVFVNNEIIGKGNSRVLKQGDIIALEVGVDNLSFKFSEVPILDDIGQASDFAG